MLNAFLYIFLGNEYSILLIIEIIVEKRELNEMYELGYQYMRQSKGHLSKRLLIFMCECAINEIIAIQISIVQRNVKTKANNISNFRIAPYKCE